MMAAKSESIDWVSKNFNTFYGGSYTILRKKFHMTKVSLLQSHISKLHNKESLTSVHPNAQVLPKAAGNGASRNCCDIKLSTTAAE